ncbi:O-antigen/teichoic acid export membrane protein [Pedobacter psychrotolerans]|uniref:O-antigen/teichoic acid export membrane protein n=1 Tax=Pedobacter psychrotolerans TaxID=1843235 RepID=A0A4R2HF74_9SPHI|nr:lipopolysaccharide biosynthesis protein [Pedobacter psychrotolerans]TCO26685.1 O-antigen/teichoic acid export membrane protein [Pedobacter psychrotolerans]GGE55710.1 hypothetical protein GCM10011413_22590 [Pedobacter psychrotolerans]
MKKNLVKSIAGSTSFKLISALISFITVPLLLHALGKESYAVWVTSTALIAWLNLFDFGSGYSLKNKVTESMAINDYRELNTLIAGTIQFYFLMSIAILLIFCGALYSVEIFKSNQILALILYLPIIFSFPFTLGHFIIQGRKKFNVFNFLLLAQSGGWFFFVLAYRFNVISLDIYTLAAIYSSLFLLTNLAIFIYSLKGLSFDIKQIVNFKNLSASKDSLKVGYRFFLLQISSLFLFSLGNILTYNNLTLSDVAEYDTINKIYLMGMTLFNVVISVYWSEISHAKAVKDKLLLSKLFRQLLIIALLFSIGAVIFTFFVPMLVSIWTKKIIIVKFAQLYPFVILVCIQAFAYSGGVILNAFERLKEQIILAVISGVLIIPLANFLFASHFSIGSVPLASSILLLPTAIIIIFKARNVIKDLS